MTDIKRKHILEYIYFALIAASSAIFIFEVPKLVFYSPLVLFASFCIYSLYNGRKIRFSIGSIVITIFAVIYVMFIYNPNQDLYYQAYIHIHAVLMFVIGYNFMNDKPAEERKRCLENYILFVSVAYTIYVLIIFYNHFNNTPADLEPRFYYSLWYSFVKKPATVISMSLVFPLIYGLYALFFLKVPKKIIGLVFIVFVMYVNIKTGTRTLVFLFPCALLAEFVCWLIFKKKKIKEGIIIAVLCSALFIAVVVFCTVKGDELAQKFSGHSFARFFGQNGSTDNRIRYNRNVLENFSLTYLGGGFNSARVGTPHNIWLYIYDHGGIVSFAVYTVFTVILVVDYIKMLINKNISYDFKALLSTALLFIFVEFMMEPFILPLPSFYILCLFILGVISGASCIGKEKSKKS